MPAPNRGEKGRNRVEYTYTSGGCQITMLPTFVTVRTAPAPEGRKTNPSWHYDRRYGNSWYQKVPPLLSVIVQMYTVFFFICKLGKEMTRFVLILTFLSPDNYSSIWLDCSELGRTISVENNDFNGIAIETHLVYFPLQNINRVGLFYNLFFSFL